MGDAVFRVPALCMEMHIFALLETLMAGPQFYRLKIPPNDFDSDLDFNIYFLQQIEIEIVSQ